MSLHPFVTQTFCKAQWFSLLILNLELELSVITNVTKFASWEVQDTSGI